jgi:hypothetical protein
MEPGEEGKDLPSVSPDVMEDLRSKLIFRAENEAEIEFRSWVLRLRAKLLAAFGS